MEKAGKGWAKVTQ